MQIFRLIIKKQHYYLLIYRKTIMFARKIPPLPAEVRKIFKKIKEKVIPNMRLFTFYFFKIYKFKVFNYKHKYVLVPVS